MKIIKPDAEILKNINPYKLVERIGRTCYKSEDKITEDSYKKFVFNLINRKHFAMLEHGRIEFAVQGFNVPMEAFANIPAINVKVLDHDLPIAIVNVSLSHLYNPKWIELYPEVEPLFRDFRAIAEAAYIEANDDAIQEAAEDGITIRHQANYLFPYETVKFTCDRGVSHEFARHRCAVAQESTRYVASSSYKAISEFNLNSDDDIISAYLSGFSMRTISEHCQLTEWQVRKLLLSNQVPIRGLNNKGNRDETYFDIIDEPEKAYLLGMIQTDGSIDKSGSFTITQHKDYMWYIEAMFHKFTDYICKFEDSNCYQIMIGCKHMVDTLINYGIVPNKTYSQTDSDIDKLWASVPYEFKGDFIRGMIDGDGHVQFIVQKGAHSKSPEIELYSANKHILELIKQHLNDVCKYECRLYNRDSGYTLHICKYSASIDIGNYLYKHFQFPFGHPKKASNWLNELNTNSIVANYMDPKFQIVLPSTWDEWDASAKFTFLRCLSDSEISYKYMRQHGMTPEKARAVLPNALKTEIILTMPRTQWNHFFNLRYFGTTGKPHPDAKRVAKIAYEKLN